MANPLDRVWYNALVDDDGSGNVGTVWNKAQVNGLLNTVDASLAGVATTAQLTGYVPDPVPGSLKFSGVAPILMPTTADGADTGNLTISGGGGGVDRGANIAFFGNEHASQAGNAILYLGRGTGNPTFIVARGTDFTTLMGISQNGVVQFPYGQLLFPTTQAPSANAYTLDDYREIPFTPYLWGATGGASGVGYVTQVGRAIKIGGHVRAWGQITLSSKGTIVGPIQVLVPFTSSAAAGVTSGVVGYVSGLAVPLTSFSLLLLPGAYFATIYCLPPGGATSCVGLDISNITSSFTFYYSISYQAD